MQYKVFLSVQSTWSNFIYSYDVCESNWGGRGAFLCKNLSFQMRIKGLSNLILIYACYGLIFNIS